MYLRIPRARGGPSFQRGGTMIRQPLTLTGLAVIAWHVLVDLVHDLR